VALDEIEFGDPNPRSIKTNYVADRDLFWVHPGYSNRLRDMGRLRPDIVFLGDSVTEGSYPSYFLDLLEKEGHTPRGVSLGVSGWSSYQGLQQLSRDVAKTRPRVVTVFFGWNDHWIGYGITDAEVHDILRSSSRYYASDIRLAQLLLKARVGHATRTGARPPRVTLGQFRDNLREIVRIARAAEIIPVLLTAPTTHQQGREPEHLADRWLTDLSELVPLHRAYVAAVREISSQEGGGPL
jgi:lysophospholipase L1-like esterase